MVPYCLGGISGPALQAWATDKVAKNEQGELQGALTIVNSLSVIVGPLLFSYIFYHFTQDKVSSYYFPGAPYILAALLMLISTFLVINTFKKPTRKGKSKTSPTHPGHSPHPI
jgi:MFS transporter, DHA1 family, tetracycline resistance protein